MKTKCARLAWAYITTYCSCREFFPARDTNIYTMLADWPFFILAEEVNIFVEDSGGRLIVYYLCPSKLFIGF